jgi:calpain-15
METILRKCQELGVQFQDDVFKHNASSLIANAFEEEGHKKMVAKNWTSITWKKASEIPLLKAKSGILEIFPELVTPSDVVQGGLGDCWFLTTISALAEYPQRIKRLFLNDKHETNAANIYGVKICKNGIWENVIVDDWLPVRNNQPVFSKSNGKFLWVPIIEKAYAKVHGSYKAIESGNIDEAMRDLTGAPSFQIKTSEKSEDDLWRIIKRCDEKKFVLSCSVHTT